MATFGVHRLNSNDQRDTFVERANDIDDLFLSVYEKDMLLLQRLLRLGDERNSSTSCSGKLKRQGVFVKLEEDLDDAFDSKTFRDSLQESRLKRSLYVKRASIKKRFEVARMCHAQLRGLVEDRGYPLFPEAGKNAATLSASQPPKKCTDVNEMYEHMDQVILFMDTQIKVFLTDIIQNLELVRDEINKVIKEFYHRLDSGELILRENANKRQIYSRLESFEGDKISIELSLSFFRDCYMKIDADAMKLLGGRLSSMEQGPGPTMERHNVDENAAAEGDIEEEEEDESIDDDRFNIQRNPQPHKIEVHRSSNMSNSRSNRSRESSDMGANPSKNNITNRDVYGSIQRAIDEARAQKSSSRPRKEQRLRNNNFDWDWDRSHSFTSTR